jgi:hypothetical protein
MPTRGVTRSASRKTAENPALTSVSPDAVYAATSAEIASGFSALSWPLTRELDDDQIALPCAVESFHLVSVHDERPAYGS